MGVPVQRLGAIPAVITATLVLVTLGACAASPATPPPAEAHTAFAPVEVKIKGDPDWLTAGFGSIWLKHPEGTVDRIDAATAKVTAQIEIHEARSEACGGIAAGVDSIWSCDRGDIVRNRPGEQCRGFDGPRWKGPRAGPPRPRRRAGLAADR